MLIEGISQPNFPPYTVGFGKAENDGNHYLGHIGHGGLWQVLGDPPKPHWGLRRSSFKKEAEFPVGFNEIAAVRDVVPGLELEFSSRLKRSW